MRLLKLILLILIFSSPFILNVLRKNLYYSKSSVVFELEKTVREKEREYMELKGRYENFLSPTYIESLGESVNLKKVDLKDYIILE